MDKTIEVKENYFNKMFFHPICESDVCPGDHLYRWRYFKLEPGIAVQLNDNPSAISVVTLNGVNTFRLITLHQFKGRGILRRAHYNQDDSYLHRIKLSGTSFTEKRRPREEVVQNALLLLDTANKNPEYIKKLFVNRFADFAKLCCTISHEEWCNRLLGSGKKN